MYDRAADGKLDGTVNGMYLILFAGVCLLWVLQTVCVRRLWDKKLSVSLHFEDSYIYEGETSALKEVVVNDKWLPVSAMGVHFAMSRNLQFEKESNVNSSVTDQTYRRDVFSFLFHQQITRTLAFCGNKRGCYQIKSAEITGYDFFFSPIGSRTFTQHTQMYVFPAQVDASRISVICNAVSGMVLSRSRLYPDPFEFSGIRKYVSFDPMNHINWKASSRTGELMVNQFDSTTNIDVVVLFDIDDPYILKNEDLQEETIRIVSSLAARFIRQKMPLRIAGNAASPTPPLRYVRISGDEFPAAAPEYAKISGSDSSKPQEIFYEYYPEGAGNIENLNQKLACLDVRSAVLSGAELLQKELEKAAEECTYIFISKNQVKENMDAVGQFASLKRQLLWVVPVHKGQDVPGMTAPYVKMLRWEVLS